MLLNVVPGDIRRISFEFQDEIDPEDERVVKVTFSASVLAGIDINVDSLILVDKTSDQTSSQADCLVGGVSPLGFQVNVIYLITAKATTSLGQVLSKRQAIQCVSPNFIVLIPPIVPSTTLPQTPPNNFLFWF